MHCLDFVVESFCKLWGGESKLIFFEIVCDLFSVARFVDQGELINFVLTLSLFGNRFPWEGIINIMQFRANYALLALE